MTETIVALSTPPGEAALHVIRMSGPKAEEILNTCFQTHSEAWRRGDVFVLCLGWFCQGEKKIDQILAVRMRAPHSFTGEDLVEIQCHGGRVNAHRILDVCCGCGARLAEAGEFSKRAFLNGKMDLIQAEALIDLITAKNDMSADLALLQMEGGLSESINVLRNEMMDVLAGVEAYIDFPDDMEGEEGFLGKGFLEKDLLRERLLGIKKSMEEVLRGSKRGRIIRDGIRTVIAGAPNVGKSSLLNAFVGEERAIVTEIPGTTRDEIHEYVHFGESVLHMIDTAGLRESSDPIEILGIERTRRALDEADIILFLVDGTRLCEDAALLPQEDEVLREYGQKAVVLVNKMDLLEKENKSSHHKAEGRRCAGIEKSLTWIPFSVKDRMGFEVLEAELKRRFMDGFNMYEQPVLSNMRQIEAVRASLISVEKVLEAVGSGVPLDLISIDIMAAVEEISLVTGHDVREDVIGRIFQRFCIGK
ncbi:MAG: tRNA uridine-5-carboxymethylaminomethyl(34) synthesis GTPase MnmE [Peptococcaceae bacterium]|nr:tRNA uridine-5-carboxymethylaminomethyl(34) synthesis GTPase MnmE [Peptococcaceae bacterium]